MDTVLLVYVDKMCTHEFIRYNKSLRSLRESDLLSASWIGGNVWICLWNTRQIKERKRISKLEHENDLKERNKKKKETDKKFKNAHEAKPKKIKAQERVGTDWDKIEKQRAEIKAV